MPRRPDFVEVFWLAQPPGLGGYPGARKLKGAARPKRKAVRRKPSVTLPAMIEEAVRAGRLGGFWAIVALRDRAGFKYERAVSLDDFVTQYQAAQLLYLPLMTVTRAVKAGRLPHRSRNGKTVVRLRDVLAEAERRGRPLKVFGQLAIQDAGKLTVRRYSYLAAEGAATNVGFARQRRRRPAAHPVTPT